MIQRIQTLWLALTIICALVLIKGTVTEFGNSGVTEYSLGYHGVQKHSTDVKELTLLKEIPVLKYVLAFVPALALAAIFLFKKRNIQKVAVLVIACFSVLTTALVIYFSAELGGEYSVKYIPGPKDLLLPVIIIAPLLALRGIIKDDKLVKSYDRLR